MNRHGFFSAGTGQTGPADGCGSAVEWMVREIGHVCRNMKKRAPGSDGEREAAEYMSGILERECGCTHVRTEHFSEHPDAFWGYFWFSMVFDVLCCAAFFLCPWLSLVSGSMALVLFLFQFVLYRQLIDRLFPERTGTNVTAVRACSGEVRRRILLNGHLDAAWEFPLNYHFGGVVFELPGLMAVIGVLFYMTLDVCVLCGIPGRVHMAGLAGLVFVPFFLLVACTYNPRRIVDGANDNLTGCFMGIAVLREMERQGIRLEHTETGVVLTGSEEAGLRGAKAWAKTHSGEFRDVPTWIVCLDTIHDPDCLMVNERDLNGTVRTDPELGRLMMEAAGDAGIPLKRGKVPMMGGATDSAAFCQGGFRSLGITGLNHRLEKYYHTRLDDPEHLNAAGLDNCFCLLERFIEKLDAGALDE